MCLDINLSFPIIIDIDNSFEVMQNIKEYSLCKKSYIATLSKLKEFIIDSNGYYYKRTEVNFIKYINSFKGFSLKYAGFGACYVEKKVERIKGLSVEELKIIGLKIIDVNKEFFSGTALNIKEWENEFKLLENKEDILRYMFYFTDSDRFYNPDIKDLKWRDKSGFI